MLAPIAVSSNQSASIYFPSSQTFISLYTSYDMSTQALTCVLEWPLILTVSVNAYLLEMLLSKIPFSPLVGDWIRNCNRLVAYLNVYCNN